MTKLETLNYNDLSNFIDECKANNDVKAQQKIENNLKDKGHSQQPLLQLFFSLGKEK